MNYLKENATKSWKFSDSHGFSKMRKNFQI